MTVIKPTMIALCLAMTGLGLAGCETAEQKLGEPKCLTHTLSGENDSVATPGATFWLKNIGTKPVNIVFNNGKTVVGTVVAGKRALFVGDGKFDYYVKLAAPGDTATIKFCK